MEKLVGTSTREVPLWSSQNEAHTFLGSGTSRRGSTRVKGSETLILFSLYFLPSPFICFYTVLNIHYFIMRKKEFEC